MEWFVDLGRFRLIWLIRDQSASALCFRFANETAVSFVDNRRQLLEALDREGAPVRLQDIKLLENEMHRAHQYMKQAERLREASQKCGEGLPTYDDCIPRDEVCNSASVTHHHHHHHHDIMIIMAVIVSIIIIMINFHQSLLLCITFD